MVKSKKGFVILSSLIKNVKFCTFLIDGIMAVSINEICENTKLAREMALMGNYDTSGVYYQGVVQQIHRLLATIADATRKAKWQVVQHQIVEEFEKVKATSNTLQLFKVDTHGERLLGSKIRIEIKHSYLG